MASFISIVHDEFLERMVQLNHTIQIRNRNKRHNLDPKVVAEKSHPV